MTAEVLNLSISFKLFTSWSLFQSKYAFSFMKVCCIERYPYDGSKVANGAGTSAIIVKKVQDQVHLKMPSKREMIVNEKCLCVFGRVSNTER